MENGITKSNEDRSSMNQNQKTNRIQVSNTKRPLFFYLNLAKRYLKQHDEVELSAVGMEVKISTVGNNNESNGCFVSKARIEIVLEKSKNAVI